MNGVVVAHLATCAAGLAVLAAWARGARRGEDPIGPPPAGPLPTTHLALLVAIAAWFLLPQAVLAAFGADGISDPGRVVLAGCVHAAIGLGLLPFVKRARGSAPLPAAGRVRVGLLAGLGTFGLAGIVGAAVEAAYAAAGATPPTQEIVAIAQQSRAGEWAGVVVSAALLAPFGEELFWRGAALPALVGPMGPGRAVVAQGLAFGAVHVVAAPPSHWPLALPLAVVGMAAGWVCLRTGSLLVPVLLHATFNAINLAFLRWGT